MKLPLAGMALVLTVAGLLWAQAPRLERTVALVSDPNSDARPVSYPEIDVASGSRILIEKTVGIDPAKKRLIDELESHERQSMELAEQLALQKSQKATEQILSQTAAKLQETVVAAFTARRKLQDLEVQSLRERLAQIEQKLAQRDQARDQIVARRVRQLSGETSDEWEDGITGGSLVVAETNVPRGNMLVEKYSSARDSYGRAQQLYQAVKALEDREDRMEAVDEIEGSELADRRQELAERRQELIEIERALSAGPNLPAEGIENVRQLGEALVIDRRETLGRQGTGTIESADSESLRHRRMPTDFLVEQQKMSEKIEAIEDEIRKTSDSEVQKLLQMRIEKVRQAIEVIKLEYQVQIRQLRAEENALISRLKHAEEELQRLESLYDQGAVSIQEVRQRQLEVDGLKNRIDSTSGTRMLFEEAEARVFGS